MKKQMDLQQSKGFTLAEALVTIAIIGILASIAVPAFMDILKRYERDSITSSIREMVKEAKIIALTEHKHMVLCPTSDFKNCSKNNPTHLMSFYDHNTNQKRDNSEAIKNTLSIKMWYGKVGFNMSARRRYMRFYPDSGMPRGHYGNITYCPLNRENMSYAKSLIISKQGRARLSFDKNGDGIDENSEGRAISCV